ncbi:hypothetical protein [Nonomuraea sp. NPDC049400]|uniref:hypothetical protein n=1 Tax=Nonomuraea sp. NPDC049400 TaxID=3364352 RepID=UPI003793AF57
MPPTSKVELYAAIRRDARAGLSGRALERKYGVERRTVVKAVASAWPEPQTGRIRTWARRRPSCRFDLHPCPWVLR